MFPSRSLEILKGRLDAVQLFLHRRDKSTTDSLRKGMQSVRNIYVLAAKMVCDKADQSTWKGIAEVSGILAMLSRHSFTGLPQFASKAVDVCTTCSSFGSDRSVPILERVSYTTVTSRCDSLTTS